MSRQEIQIVDLEPSVIGEDVTRYAIQVRGVDSNGNEGPWSSILEYESPELLPSLESNNYVEGVSGWRLDNDGTFEVNDGLIRGTLQSANYVPNSSGWALDVNGDVEFSTGTFRGALKIGTNTFNVEPTGDLWIGGTSFNNAPFAVNTFGQIQAMSISGDFIQAETILGNRIAAKTLTADNIANSTITGSLIANSTITGSLIANSTIGGSKIIDGSITNAKIEGGTITGAKIADSTISGALIANSTITSTNIGDAQIIRAKIANLAVNNAKIDDLNVDKLTGTQISGFSINGLSATFTSLSVTISNISIPGLSATGSGTFGGQVRTTSSLGFRADNMVATTTAYPIVRFDTSTATVGRLLRTSSSARYKTDIETAPVYDISALRPVTFRSTSPADDPNYVQFGVIAEEVSELGVPGLVQYNQNGEPEGVANELIGLLLLDHVKDLQKRVKDLEDNNAK